MKNKGQEDIEARIQKWQEKGKSREEITWGMMCDRFQSIRGIPDDFCSAEDPEDRVRLWAERGTTQNIRDFYSDDKPLYTD